MKVSLAAVNTEYRFVWPTGDSLPESEKVTFVCKRPDRKTRMSLGAAINQPITNERSQETRSLFDVDKLDELYASALVKIEGLEVTSESGEVVDTLGPNKVGRIRNLFTSNLGLDVETHGSLESDFAKWFSRVILLGPDLDQKKSSTTLATDGSAEVA